MIKLLACFVLLFVALVAAKGGPDHDSDGPNRGPGGSGGPHRGPGGSGGPNRGPGGFGDFNRLVSKLCANNTLAESFLSQTLALISNLQSNGTFTAVLNSQAQEIVYLQNTTNAALLSSNCTAYFSGLKSAKQADQNAQEAQQQTFKDAAEAFFQVIKSVLGINYS